MAQETFESLVVAGEFDDLMLDTLSPVNPTKSIGKNMTEDDHYVPVNYIPDEVIAMIQVWQLQRRDVMEVSGTDAPTLEEYAPLMSQTAPPKRYFRTFWRSIARRLLQAYQNDAMTMTSAST